MKFQVLNYDQVKRHLANTRSHALLGNGFSIACDPVFSYGRLYDSAVSAGLSGRAQAVFRRLGTNNFEGVLRLLEDAHWIAQMYGLRGDGNSPLMDDVLIVKNTLVEAVANSHLEHSGSVPDNRKAAALNFLKTFHNVFTTNYDLLAYWINMFAGDSPPFRDGFHTDIEDPEAEYVVFSERIGNQRGLFFIHGALHLYLSSGELRKHTWIRSGKPLTQLVREGLERGEYPLFVAEGSPEKKLEQIQRVGYLWYCLDKLARIEGPLVIFGHSLGESDRHIAEVLAGNLKLSIIYIGLYGDPESEPNQAMILAANWIQSRRKEIVETRKRGVLLEVIYYDSATARVWG